MAQEDHLKEKMEKLKLGDEDQGRGEEGEKSMTGSPVEEAQQALKEKYDEVIGEKEKEEERTGVDDAKAMLRDEYEDAKKSLLRNDGTPEPADASEAAASTKRLAHEGKGEQLETSAERSVEKSDNPGAPHESMAKLDQAKNELAAGSTQQPSKGVFGKITDAIKNVFSSAK